MVNNGCLSLRVTLSACLSEQRNEVFTPFSWIFMQSCSIKIFRYSKAQMLKGETEGAGHKS